MEENKTYIAIDLKSFYASVECRERNRDPLTTNLVVYLGFGARPHCGALRSGFALFGYGKKCSGAAAGSASSEAARIHSRSEG